MRTLGARGAGEVVVQKYGGSSLATGHQLEAVARRVADAARGGRPVVTVVSARGDTTDELIDLARGINPAPRGRELDQLLATGETASAALLAMALQHIGQPATALTGAQSGILVNGPHGLGTIVAIDTERATRLLGKGEVVVVAGFQGITASGDTITLGRGGSDTTAVALAAELGSRSCEIYTDVPGVLTADPRVVPNARLLPEVDIDVMAEMAFAGARVMHARAVELAALYGIDILVGGSTATHAGTRIHHRDGQDMLEARAAVVAVVHEADVTRVTFRSAAGPEDPARAVFGSLADAAIPADMATVTSTPDGDVAVGLTVGGAHTSAVRACLAPLAGPAGGVEVDEHLAKVSIVGKGLLSRPEYVSRMLNSLGADGVGARLLAASQLRVSVTVPSGESGRAVRVLHSEFGLDAGTEAAHRHLSHQP
ncbi:aspartate kinase [Streptomyces marincola]|uniref:Aspartokinase n=1 Tax=Streptomyces marincola TaxID=2878388 RepID=A0A1W7D1S3_9ACTN|nr:aspartate kinase [Streptomyces marincola]ARQ70952.1 aspartate kinase [Streptomyces marincola]